MLNYVLAGFLLKVYSSPLRWASAWIHWKDESCCSLPVAPGSDLNQTALLLFLSLKSSHSCIRSINLWNGSCCTSALACSTLGSRDCFACLPLPIKQGYMQPCASSMWLFMLTDAPSMVWGSERAEGWDKVGMKPSWLLGEGEGVRKKWSVLYCAWGDQVSVQLRATKQAPNSWRRAWGETETQVTVLPAGWGCTKPPAGFVCMQHGVWTIAVLLLWLYVPECWI